VDTGIPIHVRGLLAPILERGGGNHGVRARPPKATHIDENANHSGENFAKGRAGRSPSRRGTYTQTSHTQKKGNPGEEELEKPWLGKGSPRLEEEYAEEGQLWPNLAGRRGRFVHL